jgi:sugar phosphate isomerase/epimerase
MKALEEMGQMGFRWVEAEVDMEVNFDEYSAQKKVLKDKLSAIGLKISGLIGVIANAFSRDRTLEGRTTEGFARMCELTKYLGSEDIIICMYLPREFRPVKGSEVYRGSPAIRIELPSDFNWDMYWNIGIERVQNFAHIAGDHGLRLLIENRVGDLIHTSDGLIRLLDIVGEKNVGVLADFAHFSAGKERIEFVVEKLGSRLQYVHLSDNDSSDSRHMPIGHGSIDFPAIIKILVKMGFSGPVNIDIGGVCDIQKEVAKAKAYFEDLIYLSGGVVDI